MRENQRRAEQARRTLGLYDRDLEENPDRLQERLLDLFVDCCHLVQGASAHLNLRELIEQAERIFHAEIEQASRAVVWHDGGGSQGADPNDEGT